MRFSYFQLKRGKTYTCSRDKNSSKDFEYRLYRHYLQYRKVAAMGTPLEEPAKWSGVWNSEWYNDNTTYYEEKTVK